MARNNKKNLFLIFNYYNLVYFYISSIIILSMNKSYLPSKLFMIRVASVVVIVAVVFGLIKLVHYLKNKPVKSTPAKMVVVGDLIQKDSNSNGIPDWEEYLWGLDPNKNGPENKEFILAKKKSLSDNGQITEDNSNLSQNELLSRQFFAAIISLQQTGNLDDESIKSLTEAVGNNVTIQDIKDIYSNNMMTIVSDTQSNKDKYRNDLSKLAQKYSNADIGSELTIIIQGYNNQDPQAMYAVQSIAESYQKFGAELIKIPTPRSMVETSVTAANNYEKNGQTIKNMAKGLNDPIVGMRSILSYKKYNDELANDLEKISELLQ